MDEQELKDIFKLLDGSGVKYELCDTPVPVSLSGVPCGFPEDMGDECIDDYYLVPKSLVGPNPEMLVHAIGDSMLEAGYEPGDQLRIRFGTAVHDGDDVLAVIDGAALIKTLYTDEEGNQWLVPRNEKYDAILLTEDMDVRFLGIVMGVVKAHVKAPSRELLQSIRRTKNKQRQASRLSDEQVDLCIMQMGGVVKHARQWYAVFRAMVDYNVIAENAVQQFCERVRNLLPAHEHLPNYKEVGRMAVLSFAKRVSMWNEDNAPVTGYRYRDYLSIALQMGRLLGGES